jgi:diguanylate cyclase (GGDEF)-like protein/PAS domain S-box-containing protein
VNLLSTEPLYIVYLLALVVSILISVALISYLFNMWRQRIKAVIPVLSMLVAILILSSGYLLEQFSQDLNSLLFMYNIEYLGVATIPVFFLLFALQYNRLDKLITRRRLILLLVIPVITIFLVWTKDYHSIMYQDPKIVVIDHFNVIETKYGIWFWVFVSYQYLINILSTVIMVRGLFRHGHCRYDEALIIGPMILMPFIANIVYVFRLFSPLPYVDWTGSAFSITAICMTVAISRQRLLSVIPVARNSTIEMMNDGYLVIDEDNYIIDLNRTMQTIIGISPREATDKKLTDFMPGIINLNGNTSTKQEILLNVQGEERYYRVHLSPLNKSKRKNKGNILLFYDITESKLVERKLADIATHDILTGLPNRLILQDRCSIAYARAKRSKTKFAVMVGDIDYFKDVNDTFGHITADRLLIAVAQRLTSILRAEDTLARVGGDEFVILLTKISGEKEVINAAERIMEAFHEKFLIDNNEIKISFSIGISIYPDNGDDIWSLMRMADQAMYIVKKQGRANFLVYKNANE